MQWIVLIRCRQSLNQTDKFRAALCIFNSPPLCHRGAARVWKNIHPESFPYEVDTGTNSQQTAPWFFFKYKAAVVPTRAGRRSVTRQTGVAAPTRPEPAASVLLQQQSSLSLFDKRSHDVTSDWTTSPSTMT